MGTIKVLIAEEQEILREAYRSILSEEPSIELVGVESIDWVVNRDKEDIEKMLLNASPDILVLGTKLVQTGTIKGLEAILVDFPNVGIVLLSAHYDAEGIGKLKGGKEGKILFDYITDNCEIQYLDMKLCDKAIETFLKYDGTLSFADSVSIEIMRQKGISEIASFDRDFDKVKGIIRIY